MIIRNDKQLLIGSEMMNLRFYQFNPSNIIRSHPCELMNHSFVNRAKLLALHDSTHTIHFENCERK